MFLNAEPQSTGKNLNDVQPMRIALTISASVIWSALPSMYLVMIASSTSAQASIIFSRYSSHFALMSAGISTQLYFWPFASSSKMAARIVMRSTTPLC